jgi:phosphonate transport system substrate-binding protein
MTLTYAMTASPDFSTKYISGWFLFNTWLQKALDEHIHLELFNDFKSQRAAIAADKVDIIYANPYDASLLVRDKGFTPLVRPIGKADEAVIVVLKESAIQTVEGLQPGTRVACTDDPDVLTMALIMLEPADLSERNIVKVPCETYIVVGKNLIHGDADVGVFLCEIFDELSEMVRGKFRVLVRSQISVLRHALLVGPRLQREKCDKLRALLLAMKGDPKSASILKDMGMDQGWEDLSREEVEFMIDLMDTLLFQPE